MCLFNRGLPHDRFRVGFSHPPAQLHRPARNDLQRAVLARTGAVDHRDGFLDDGSEPPSPLGLASCEEVPFQPNIDFQPTTDQAETLTGLDFSIGIPPDGFLNPTGFGQSEAKKMVLALPEEMVLNPEVTGDTVTCTADQYAAESIEPAPEEGCPQDRKSG